MADSDPREEMLSRHRKEKKDLLAQSQKMKHGIPKGDKKKKKDITTEIDQMFADLSLKHEEELKTLGDDIPTSEECSSHVIETVEKSVTDEVEEPVVQKEAPASRVSKAQKRRNKKSQLVKKREEAIAEQEMLNVQGSRYLESSELEKKLSARNLCIHEIPPDGNCLYKAIEHQLALQNVKDMTVLSLREATSMYLLSHKEEFIPFLTNPETGDMLSDAEFVKYCDDIKSTTVWGGQVEIQVLAHVCGKSIEVIQAEGPSVIAGNETGDCQVIISYHRHAFGLGEHYNSVIPKVSN